MLGSTSTVHTAAGKNNSSAAGALFRLTFEHATTGIALITRDGRIAKSNPALCRMLGYTDAELSSRTFRDITYLDDLPESDELYRRIFVGESGGYDLEQRYVRKDGEIVWGHLVVALVRDAVGTPLHFISMINDITDHRDASEELEQVKNRNRTIFDNVDDCLFITDSSSILTYVSRSCAKLLGWSPEELVGNSLYKYIYPDERDAVRATFEQFLTSSDKRIHVRCRVSHKEGEWVWVDSYAWAIPGPSGRRHEMGGIFRDTSEYQREQTAFVNEIEQAHARRQAEEEIAITDQLTGLRNRQAADDMLLAKLTGVRASAFPVGCFVVDIDHFKRISKQHGPTVAEAIVKQLASVVTASCRHDDFVARYGEDQFLVVLPGTNPGGTIICGEKLLRNVREADWSTTPEGPINVSIGATCMQFGSGLTLPELVGILDSQLQQAKDDGGNRIVMNTRQITGKPQF